MHASAMPVTVWEGLAEGDRVAFEVVPSPEGRQDVRSQRALIN
jgi:cold shock CspA family protein